MKQTLTKDGGGEFFFETHVWMASSFLASVAKALFDGDLKMKFMSKSPPSKTCTKKKRKLWELLDFSF